MADRQLGVDVLAAMRHEHAATIKPRVITQQLHYRDIGDAFARINAASAVDGVVLRVAAGTQLTAPVQLVFVGATAPAELAWHARNVIELGEGSALALVEQHLGTGERAPGDAGQRY